MLRTELLKKVEELISIDREKEYGPPGENLRNTATLWTAYLAGRFSDSGAHGKLTGEDVAWLNVLQKISRSMSGNAGPDTYTDAAGYSALAGECHYEETNK